MLRSIFYFFSFLITSPNLFCGGGTADASAIGIIRNVAIQASHFLRSFLIGPTAAKKRGQATFKQISSSAQHALAE